MQRVWPVINIKFLRWLLQSYIKWLCLFLRVKSVLGAFILMRKYLWSGIQICATTQALKALPLLILSPWWPCVNRMEMVFVVLITLSSIPSWTTKGLGNFLFKNKFTSNGLFHKISWLPKALKYLPGWNCASAAKLFSLCFKTSVILNFQSSSLSPRLIKVYCCRL